MVGYFTAMSVAFWVFAQDDGSGSGSGFPFDLGVYGVAATTVAILLYFCRILWNDNKELRAENSTVQTVAIERVADIAAKSSTQLQESAKTLEATTVMMHQLSGRPGLSPEQLAELNFYLRTLRELQERRTDK